MSGLFGVIKKAVAVGDNAITRVRTASSPVNKFKGFVENPEQSKPTNTLRPPLRSLVGEGGIDNLRPIILSNSVLSPGVDPSADTFSDQEFNALIASVGANLGAGASAGVSDKDLDASRVTARDLRSRYLQAAAGGPSGLVSIYRNELRNHLENDYIPKLEQRQAALEAQLPNNPGPTLVRAEHREITQELEDARVQLDRLGGPTKGNSGLESGEGTLALGDAFQNLDFENPPENLNGSYKTPAGFSYSVDVSDVTSEEIGPNGEETVTIEISRSVQEGLSQSASAGAVSAGSGVFEGHDLDYSITIPKDHYQQVLAGDAPFPDPSDLSTLPDGSFVLLRSEDVSGVSESYGYQLLTAGGSTSTAEGNAVGLQVNGDTVRVLAGPTEAVTASSSVGLGHGFEVGNLSVSIGGSLGGSTTVRDTDLVFTDIALPSGQAAYADFIRTGEIPPADAVGVRTAGTVEITEITGSTNATGTLEVGPFQFEAGVSNEIYNGTLTEVTYNDGSREVSGIVEGNDISFFREQTFDADGKLVSEQEGLVLDGYDESFNGNARRVTGEPQGTGRNDLQIEFTSEEYTELRERVIASVTDDEAQAEGFRRGPDADGTFTHPDGSEFTVPGFTRFEDAILANPDLESFYFDPRVKAANSGPTDIVQGLITVHDKTSDQGTLPGTYTFY